MNREIVEVKCSRTDGTESIVEVKYFRTINRWGAEANIVIDNLRTSMFIFQVTSLKISI